MLRQPFSEYSPEALCLFLRFVYRSDLLSSANELAAHSVLLPSVVRLAHALEATQQLVPLCKGCVAGGQSAAVAYRTRCRV